MSPLSRGKRKYIVYTVCAEDVVLAAIAVAATAAPVAIAKIAAAVATVAVVAVVIAVLVKAFALLLVKSTATNKLLNTSNSSVN